MSTNARLAGAALGHLAGLGVREFVVCAGARNAPLVTSLLAACQEKELRVYHHFDERAAAFFGMGLAKKTGEPVAILTTSGTAVAELLPATIEAFYSGIPLILVTADRPPAFRGSGAPQAIEQAGIFGSYAPVMIDVTGEQDLALLSGWAGNEPIHLNLCFGEPGPGDVCADWESVTLPVARAHEKHDMGETLSSFCEGTDRLVVLLGELPAAWQPEVVQFLSGLGAPVWAEATSGLRESPILAGQLIRSESLLGTLASQKILRLGGVPSLRFWRDLEQLPEIAVLSLSRRPFSGLARASGLLVSDEFPGFASTQEGRVEDLTLLSDEKLDAALLNHRSSEPAMLRELSRQIPSEALVFLGNSLPIREWNLAASLDIPHPRTFASRGANGIDGQIATFLGLSEGEAESWGIVGDLTALYDLNAPALIDQLSRGRRRLVILNNGGGRIFSRLPSMAGLSEARKQVTENRHSRRFADWAAMWDLDYVSWMAGDPFPLISGDFAVIEILLDNESTEAFWEARK